MLLDVGVPNFAVVGKCCAFVVCCGPTLGPDRPSARAMEAVIHALRAENAALKAEVAAFRADNGLCPSVSHPPLPDDAALCLPADLRTWESVGAGVSLDGADMERYARHIALPAFGVGKQAALATSTVLIVGCGGLGSPAALYLAGAGVGRLHLADADVVERSNLHRQIIHTDARCGAPKALSAAVAIAQFNRHCVVTTHTEGVTNQNAVALVKQADCVLDCTDNAQTRYLLSDACAVLKKPLVSAAAVGTEGQLTVYVDDGTTSTSGVGNFRATGGKETSTSGSDTSATATFQNPKNHLPCYRCIFPVPPSASDRPNCAQGGVLGPVPGVMGVLQALEAIKVCTNLGERFGGRLLMFDALAANRNFSSIALRGRDPKCVACGDRPSISSSKIAQYDYDAFVGGATACDLKRTSAGENAVERKAARQATQPTPPDANALPAALDDAAAARLRNASAARGDGDAPWASTRGSVGTPSGGVVTGGRGVVTPSSTGRAITLETETEDAVHLDLISTPPLHARAEASHRVAPSFLLQLRRALGEAVVVVDVRPKHLSDAAKLKGTSCISQIQAHCLPIQY